MTIKILKCKIDCLWYKGKIGKEYRVIQMLDVSYEVVNPESMGRFFVLKSDTEIVKP